MEKVRIEKFSKEYQDEVIDLILDIQQKEFSIPIRKEDQPDLSDIPNFYQTQGGNFWIAVDDQQVVGTIALIDIGNHQGALRKMFVKTEYRGKTFNTAKLLLSALLSWASDHHMQEIFLGTTEKFLAAHRFYEKNKFAQIPKEHLPRAFPLMKVDTRFYKLML
ncbi:GNAT family N-acetyltransferase [Sporomusa acidovorans]|uniref:N-acetyltransferase domain-containing protein n=1 Tax=Sporomusa acidovorans (strain ATCC 49682 / DSM 3132 / Mol) TaxID=1123286 RepID=A0ABZ3IZI2_SPOA4|nr:GNAT family N-acetyltransferase [Sporomusa acidovorans]OZC18295.1 putative acetyltransferase [Sporomusa acidovorans DSM 3132]SDF20763.1 Acetyltransferase (GNAT) domain-containing protein [Sporomusa acidovorans]